MTLALAPTVAELASDPLVHRFGDLWNPPGLTNHLGCVQSDLDPVAVRSVNFPPYAMSDSVTGTLFLDDRLFSSLGVPVTTVWRPDRIDRESAWDGLRIRTTTVMAPGRMGVVVRLSVANEGLEDRWVPVRLALRSTVTKSVARWTEPHPPWEDDNSLAFDEQRGALVYTAQHSAAATVQGGLPRPDALDHHGFRWDPVIRAGDAFEASFLVAVGDDAAAACALYDELATDPEAVVTAAHRYWDEELAAVFTPGNDRYSGSLPLLETSDPDLRRIWLMGVIGVVYFKRDNPFSVLGRTYDTLMPKYWQSLTFLWDYSLSSLVHSLLDPVPMRRYLEHWMATDVHTHMGTEWLTGKPVGMWYAVNDYAMCRTLDAYLRATGDVEWLARELPGPAGDPMTVIGHLDRFVGSWRAFRTESGLADYGGIGNLLECVSTYVHEVAGLNAANAWMLRTAGQLARHLGDDLAGCWYDLEAHALVADLQQLYAEGQGYWYARHPDGSHVPVRHCYDFSTVAATIGGDLTEAQRREMVWFFVHELQTPTWMRALSDRDPDASYSVRPDHQWTGAYPAWPPGAAAALYTLGEPAIAADWIRGLAKSANQGPFGQSHFADGVLPPESGGALKAPAELPWINDWTCSANGAWVSLVVESVFGVQIGLDGTVTARPQLAGLDESARLVGLRVQGRTYDVDRDGVHERP
jgi:hypothetical protein